MSDPYDSEYIRLRCENPKCTLYFLTLWPDRNCRFCLFCSTPPKYTIYRQALPELYLYALPFSSWLITAGRS